MKDIEAIKRRQKQEMEKMKNASPTDKREVEERHRRELAEAEEENRAEENA